MEKLSILPAFIILFMLPVAPLEAQDNIPEGREFRKSIRQGNKKYDRNENAEAERIYSDAAEKEPHPIAEYNLGNAKYRNGKKEESMMHYQNVTERSMDPALKARAYHNLGNLHYENQNFDKSVSAYKEALKLNPNNRETKENLYRALQQMKIQKQQQQQQQQEQQEQEESQKENENEQENKSQSSESQSEENRDERNQSDETENSESQSDDEEQEQELQTSDEISDLEMNRTLNTLQNKEKEVLENMEYSRGKEGQRQSKDW